MCVWQSAAPSVSPPPLPSLPSLLIFSTPELYHCALHCKYSDASFVLSQEMIPQAAQAFVCDLDFFFFSHLHFFPSRHHLSSPPFANSCGLRCSLGFPFAVPVAIAREPIVLLTLILHTSAALAFSV